MKDILIMKDKKGGTAILTTNSPVSHYGIPTLRIEADDISGDFAPADIIKGSEGMFTAASVVAGWAIDPKRTKDELTAARRYLSQWPEGPQL